MQVFIAYTPLSDGKGHDALFGCFMLGDTYDVECMCIYRYMK